MRANLLLLLGREELDDPADRLGRVQRVQRGKDEVPRLRGLHRRLRGLCVAELADQDHVRVLAQRPPKGLAERGRVDPHLALVDDALPVVVQELDRVLDRDDVALARVVNVTDDRREGRRLAGAGRARAEDESALRFRKLRDSVRQPELDERRDDTGDQAEGERDRSTLAKAVHSETWEARRRVRDVELARLVERGAASRILGGDDGEHALEVLGLEDRPTLDRGERPVVSEDGRLRDFQVDIARAGFDGTGEQ